MIDESSLIQLPPDLLRTFIAAMDTGSFTTAAQLVHRTQSAVSMQIKKLERDLGQQLFLREGRGVVPTPEGDMLYRYAQRLLALHEETLVALRKPRLHGVVRFGTPEDYATRYLPSALQRFAAVHPSVQVEVYCDESSRLKEQFHARELDIVLTTEEHANQTDTKPLPLAWLMAEHGAPVEQCPLPLALFHAGCLFRRNGLTALEQAGIPYRIAYSSPSLAGVLAAIQAGLAVGPVSINTYMQGCRLALPQDGLPPIAPVGMRLKITKKAHSAVLDSFAGFLSQELGLKPS